MKVAIIDADLLGRTKHRFPNLVCEKLSAYWKERGAEVELKLNYEELEKYDEVFISKVFTDTWVPDWILEKVDMDAGTADLPSNIHVGGTGFFFAHAPNLDDEIEHHMPDYHLYDEWINGEVERAKEEHERAGKHFNKRSFMVQFKEYTDYSIGFVTRGCFRKCPFCVNQKYDRVFLHSPLEEFYDSTRKKVCLLDDNVFGCPQWKDILEELIALKKPFKFKQGMDERILTEEKCKLLFNASYDGDYTFAFDNVSDYDLIHNKLKLIRKYSKATNIKFYVLVGFESTDASDIENMWKRVELLMRYQCLPYIMRYRNKNETPWKMVLKEYIETVREHYDYILIDCMPSLGMLTINALACADTTLIPVQAAYLPVKGLEQLLKTIFKVKRQINSLIAHRLKTVRNADRILVLNQGRIVQQGRHEELIQQEGIYKRFVESRELAASWKL